MFEVGKKYKSNAVNGLVIEVLCATNKNAFSRVVGHEHPGYIGVETTYGQDKYVLWKEYKEPRTITRWINVYERDGELFTFLETKVCRSIEEAERSITMSHDDIRHVAIVPITYTEPL